MTTITFALNGQMKSGKNGQKIRRRWRGPGFVRHAAPAFEAWRHEMLRQIKAHRLGKFLPLVGPLRIDIEYVPGDRILRDGPGIQDALFHVFERAGVVKNDAQFAEIHFVPRIMDRARPRANITITTATVSVASA